MLPGRLIRLPDRARSPLAGAWSSRSTSVTGSVSGRADQRGPSVLPRLRPQRPFLGPVRARLALLFRRSARIGPDAGCARPGDAQAGPGAVNLTAARRAPSEARQGVPLCRTGDLGRSGRGDGAGHRPVRNSPRDGLGPHPPPADHPVRVDRQHRCTPHPSSPGPPGVRHLRPHPHCPARAPIAHRVGDVELCPVRRPQPQPAPPPGVAGVDSGPATLRNSAPPRTVSGRAGCL